MNRTLMQEQFNATLGGFFGVVALVLATIGLYGVMEQSVTRRTREIGIRMALGAEARRVRWSVLRDAMMMVAIGTFICLVAAIGLTRYTESMLYGVKAQDPWTFSTAGAILITVTAIAGFLPARRATRIYPIQALREVRAQEPAKSGVPQFPGRGQGIEVAAGATFIGDVEAASGCLWLPGASRYH